MALELQKAVLHIVQRVTGGVFVETPQFLNRPGKRECGNLWGIVSEIYSELTQLILPETMPLRNRRTVDAVLCANGKRYILEVDEIQHFNEFRRMTFEYYPRNHPLSFDKLTWIKQCELKRKLERGGFAKSVPPLFPGENGRHRQRAFRDALCDLLPSEYGYGPTIRIADFEVKSWISLKNACDKMAKLLENRLGHQPL
jgi:hypothetical protein